MPGEPARFVSITPDIPKYLSIDLKLALYSTTSLPLPERPLLSQNLVLLSLIHIL